MLKRILLLCGILTTVVATAQTPTIRVDVPLVMVDVQVSDAAGRPVTNLTREDFQIFEDGAPREIRVFEAVDSPYSIQLLFERSTDMREYWPLLETVMARFLNTLKSQDRVSIGAFDRRSRDVHLLLDWREARKGEPLVLRIDPEVYSLVLQAPFAAKDFSNSMEWAAHRVQAVNGRKGVIVFGSGWELDWSAILLKEKPFAEFRNIQDDDFKRMQRTVAASGARFDFVALNTDLNPYPYLSRQAPGFADAMLWGISVRAGLEQLAAISGGRVAFPRRPEDLGPLYETIARELGTSYTLGYSPSAPSRQGVSHRIEVRSRQGLKIQQSRDLIR